MSQHISCTAIQPPRCQNYLRVLLGAIQCAGATALRVKCDVCGGLQTLPVGAPLNISTAAVSKQQPAAAAVQATTAAHFERCEPLHHGGW